MSPVPQFITGRAGDRSGSRAAVSEVQPDGDPTNPRRPVARKPGFHDTRAYPESSWILTIRLQASGLAAIWAEQHRR